jgi:hypothetical protein
MVHQHTDFRQVNLPEYTVVRIRLSNSSASLALPLRSRLNGSEER